MPGSTDDSTTCKTTQRPVTERQATERPAGDRWGRIPAWWLDHPELDADGLAVLAALSTYADEDGVCWPSQATLAAKLKRSRPTVNRILARVEALGLVVIEHRSGINGGRLSCRYRLRLSCAPDSRTDSPCPAVSQEQPEPEQIQDTPSGREPAMISAVISAPQPVPPDWSPTAEDRAWAMERFPAVDLDRHAELFVRRCQAHGYRYRNVGEAWRSWLLQDIERDLDRDLDRNRRSRPGYPAAKSHPKPAAQHASDSAERRVAAWANVASLLNTAPSNRIPGTAVRWGQA